jgi:hypothetical protein
VGGAFEWCNEILVFNRNGQKLFGIFVSLLLLMVLKCKNEIFK